MVHPVLFLFIFVFLATHRLNTDYFSGIWTQILQVERKHGFHLTTTTATIIGQSYKHSATRNYNSRIVLTANFSHYDSRLFYFADLVSPKERKAGMRLFWKMTSKSCGFVDKYLTDDGGYIEGFKLNFCTFLILFSYNYVSIESFDGIKRSLIFKSCPKKKPH